MSQKVTLNLTDTIQFPPCCATCLATEELQTKSLTTGRVASVRPNLVGLTFRTQLMDMTYPVCPNHAKNSFWEYIYTRQTLAFKLFRGFMYLYGPMSLLLVILYAITLPFGQTNPNRPDPSWFFVGLIIFSAISFVFLVKAMFSNAVKATSFNRNTITLKFRNEDYAHKFLLLNRKTVQR